MSDPVTVNPTVLTSVGDMSLPRIQAQSFGTATATSGAAISNAYSGKITTESLSTAAGATYTLTLTNSLIAAADVVLANVGHGSDTTGTPAVTSVTPAAGNVVIVIQNIHATAAFNGTLQIGYHVLKAIA